jgi:glycosyltransferase involved in cell wall biosynthesis
MSSERRRLLLLAPIFPPDLGVATVRVSQLAELLPERGWDVDVVTLARRADRFDTDAGGLGGHTRVRYIDFERVAAQRSGADRPEQPGGPRNGASRVTLQRRLKLLAFPLVRKTAVPDVDVRWWPRWTPRLHAILDELRPDVVLSSSPQHSLHEGGRLAARHLDVPWVADFRDPLVDDPRYGPFGWRRVRRSAFHRFERGIYDDADLVVHAIPLHHRIALERYAAVPTPKLLLTNGFPPGLVALCDRPRRPGRTRLCLAGKTPDREFMALVGALGTLVAAGADVELVHMGEQPAHVSARATSVLGTRYTGLGLVPHATALEHIAEADVLLSVLSSERSRMMLLSSKLFEYLATGRPVIAVNPTQSDRALLADYPAALVVDDPGHDAVHAALEQALAPLAPAPPEWLERFRRTYDRSALAARYAEALDALV